MNENSEDTARFREYAEERDMERFWKEARGLKSEPARQRWFLPLLLAFIVISIPFYLPAGRIEPVILGFPLWVWMPLLCTIGVSALTALGALKYWKDDDSK